MARAAAKSKTSVSESVENVLLEIQEEKTVEPKVQKKKEEDIALIKAASGKSAEKIIQEMSVLKLDVTRSIDTLSEKLLGSFKQFEDLEKSVELEKKALEEIYQIRHEADTFAALIEAQRVEREKFETGIEEKKALWQKEAEQAVFNRKEQESALKKERAREEEEYTYNLKLNRTKEQDLYEAGRVKREAELALRETALREKESQFADYQKRVENFEKEMAAAVKKAETELREKLENAYSHEKALSQKEIDGDKKLTIQQVASLELKVKEQEKQIAELSRKAAEAGAQMQAIALKALESTQTRVMVQKEDMKG